MRQDLQWSAPRSTGLVDVLDPGLDKGLVVAVDIKISLAEVELLTIGIRFTGSVDKAEQVGLDRWKSEYFEEADRRIARCSRDIGNIFRAENESLGKQVELLECKVAQLVEVKEKRARRAVLAAPTRQRR